MCDEYLDGRTKAFWRAMVGDEELDKEKEVRIEVPDLLSNPLKLEPSKPEPKPLVR